MLLFIYLHLNGSNERARTGLSSTSGAVIGQPAVTPCWIETGLNFFCWFANRIQTLDSHYDIQRCENSQLR